jgi:hypothetical protein
LKAQIQKKETESKALLLKEITVLRVNVEMFEWKWET